MKVIIVGAGFGGLSAAMELRNSGDDVILIDRTNHHLFQPLLYQVAVSALSPGDIAYPIRTIFRKSKNIRTMMDEVVSVELPRNIITLGSDRRLDYDYLILAPGARTTYFNKWEWSKYAFSLKTLSDALKIRENILLSFEKAEQQPDIKTAQPYLRFVIVGGGPTGVELAGSIAELIHRTILPDFPHLNSKQIEIVLIDSGKRLLSSFPEELSSYAEMSLRKLKVELLLETRVTDITDGLVETTRGIVEARNIFWAAGNSASPLLDSLGVCQDKTGRVTVLSDCSIPNFPNVFVIGDSACFRTENGEELPAIAPVAMQQGRFVARIIKERIPFDFRPTFQYRDKGTMATIGKARAVAMLKGLCFKGFFAWLVWSLVHIFFLIGFRNRIRVMLEWIWYYITFKSGARLIVQNYGSKVIEKSDMKGYRSNS